MAHSVQLDPWNAISKPPSADGSVEGQIEFALRAAVLAPSSHNTQPWHFRVRGETIELFADRSRALPVVDPHHRALVMSCGAALFHLRVALRVLGRDPVVTRKPTGPNPDLLALIELGPRVEPTAEDRRLFEAIPERHTNRLAFERRSIPKRVLQELKHAAEHEGAELAVVTADSHKDRLSELIAEGDRLQWDDRRFRAELAAWSRANHSDKPDGIPGYGLGHGDASSVVGPLVIRTFDLGDGQAARDRQLADGSPALAVLLTNWEGPAEWLAAGEALDHVLLRAQAEGVVASFLNQPVEEASLRPRLRKLLGEHGFPQLVLRLGYPTKDARPTPRRALEDIVL